LKTGKITGTISEATAIKLTIVMALTHTNPTIMMAMLKPSPRLIGRVTGYVSDGNSFHDCCDETQNCGTV